MTAPHVAALLPPEGAVSRLGAAQRRLSMKSLVIAPQWIGDAVMSQPLLARLAARGERITVAALPWVAPVYRAMPEAAEVIELPFAHGRLDWGARRRIAAGLRGRFDTAYVLPNSIKSALIPWLAGIRRRVGYRGEGRVLLLNERLPNPAGRPPMVAFYSALAGDGSELERPSILHRRDIENAKDRRETSISSAQLRVLSPSVVNEFERPRLHMPADALNAACAQAGVTAGAFFAFAPGAEYGPAKCWPAEHYAALAQALHAGHGLPVLLLGSGKEAALCERIAAAAPGACRVLAGKTPLIDAMALIAAAQGIVSNDSGLMHVAAAFGVPQVAVFGSTSPEHTPPLNRRAAVIWLKDELQLDCMPCFERTCRFGHTRCLTEVTPHRVAGALHEALTTAA